MTTPWKKAVRDFWRERTRTALVIVAIAVGIAAFSTVLSAYAILTRELDRSYAATNPASATIRTDAVDEAMLRAVRANPAIRDAEPRRVQRWRIRTGPMRWRALTLFVIDDFAKLRVSTIAPQKGAWPPRAGEILIERDAMQVAKTRIGATVMLKDAGGDEFPLRVAGTVHDIGQAQARMENMVYAYVARETLPLLDQEPTLDQLKFTVAEKALDEEHIRRVAADVRATINRSGHRVDRVDVPPPGKHPHAGIHDVLFGSMIAFGLFVLALSGIIVVNLLTALMASQVRQIGVMQTVGGTRAQIARIYFSQSLLLGIAALAIAIPAGMWGARVLCRYEAVLLNYDVGSFAVPMWVYALDVVVGILVPLLAAAIPVWRGCGIPVREALADFGGSQRVFALRVKSIAVRNAFRRPKRLILTVLTLATGGLFFMVAMNVRASLIRTLDNLFGQQKYDLSVSLAEMVPIADVARVVRNTPGIAKAEYWTVFDGDDFTIVAMPPGSPLVAPRIIDGRAMRRGDSGVAVVNSALAARRRLRVGDRLTTFRVIGIARESFAPATAYVPLVSNETNSLRLVLDGSDADTIKTALENNLRREGIATRSSNTKSETRYAFDQHMVMIYIFLIVMSCVIVGVGGLGLMTTLSLNVLERRREMGVLRAIGATPLKIWSLIVTEGAAIAVLSWALASIVAWPLSRAIGYLLVRAVMRGGLDTVIDVRGVAIWLAVALALGVTASFVPAWHASRAEVREALGYE